MASDPLQQSGAGAQESIEIDDFASLLQRNSSPRTTRGARRSRRPSPPWRSRHCRTPTASATMSSPPSTRWSPRSIASCPSRSTRSSTTTSSRSSNRPGAGSTTWSCTTATGQDLKIRVMNISRGRTVDRCSGSTATRPGIRARCSRRSTNPNSASSAASPTARSCATMQFDHSAADLEVMKGLAQDRRCRARAVHRRRPVRTCSAWRAGPRLSNPRDLAKLFDATEYAAWRSFRASDDSRYLALTMPRFLGRPTYGAEDRSGRGVRLRGRRPVEITTITCGSMRPTRWACGSPRRSATYGWCTRIRGVESGGTVEGPADATFPTDDGGVDMKCPTEIAISDRREAELSELGLLALIHRKNTDQATFIGAQTVHKRGKIRRSGCDRQRATCRRACRISSPAAASRIISSAWCATGSVARAKGRSSRRELSDWIHQYVDCGSRIRIGRNQGPSAAQAGRSRKWNRTRRIRATTKAGSCSFPTTSWRVWT